MSTVKQTIRLLDIGKNPLKEIKYQIKDTEGKTVKAGTTDSKGAIVLIAKPQTRFFLHLQPLKKGKMRQYREFTTQKVSGTAIWHTSLRIEKVELKPDGKAGDYWRGTYIAKAGDTLESIAKKYGALLETLASLNPKLIVDSIKEGTTVRVPPNKTSTNRNTERKNPPKPKAAPSTPPPKPAPASGAVAQPTPSAPSNQPAAKRVIKIDPQPIKTETSTNSNKHNIVTLTPECICKKHNLVWGAKVSCAFRKKVVEIAQRQNCDPNDLMAVMATESNGTFWPHQIAGKLNPSTHPKQKEVTAEMIGGKAVGLIQFTPKAITELNNTLKVQGKPTVTAYKLSQMTAVTQLSYVEMHIAFWRKVRKIKSKLTISDLYTSIFAPAHMGKAENAVLYQKGGAAYKANESVDGNHDGLITKAELANRASEKLHVGANHKSDYSDHEGLTPSPSPAAKIAQANEAKKTGAQVKSDCKDGCSVKPPAGLTSSKSNFDKDKFAETLRKNAHSKSTGYCARYVRLALEAGGANTSGRPGSAYLYGPLLKKNGFQVIPSEGYSPQKGDIYIINKFGNHPHGHIAGYDGSQWISDFKQRGVNIYRGAPIIDVTYYRIP